MLFNRHSDLEGAHAFLSASKGTWIDYTSEKLEATYESRQAVLRGTELHEIAAKLITMKVKLPRSQKTLNMYVNDAIGFRMQPEVVLAYSPVAFGTADAISFRDNLLRIHDLKTGVHPANMRQLRIYAAFFCLEYRHHPAKLNCELRIYQNDDIVIEHPDPEEILRIMAVTEEHSAHLERLRSVYE